MRQKKHSSCSTCTSRYEEEVYRMGYSRVAGLDEVGRGALSGPVLAAAVILDPAHIPEGIDDSKKLSPDRREVLFREIVDSALSWGVGQIDPEAIDQEDILKATLRAMALAVSKLSPCADFLLIDAVRLHAVDLPQKSIIKGDTLSVSIAAASIVAKVTRDAIMMEFDRLYPQYYFRQNKGYGTREHLESLRRFGPSPIHRRTFRPVFQRDIPFSHAGE
ncbi:MAG: ribonuclease HII [Acidobacteriia bacterium]|nr:ribonuclease HII [Terriglobia bacterium]